MLKGKKPLLIAGILGVLAAIVAFQVMHRHEKAWAERNRPVDVAVVSRDVQEGEVLNWDMLARSQMPAQFMTGSVVRPEQVSNLVGQRFAVPLKAGDPVQWNQFRSAVTFDRLSSMVRETGRAFSIDIGGSAGVAGWVRPADHVDIMGTFQDPKDNQMVTVTLMQNVVVMATGSQSVSSMANLLPGERREVGYNTITLWVLPEEAEILALAAELGTLRLTLRNPHDMSSINALGKTNRDTIFTGVRAQEAYQRRLPMLPTVDRLTSRPPESAKP
ncbi:MAG: Flp pilus assembly protein CpaB [Myxococcales bacterium]|nr:Flp pilus assembly protein CpaB [Myxococcales bacterium]